MQRIKKIGILFAAVAVLCGAAITAEIFNGQHAEAAIDRGETEVAAEMKTISEFFGKKAERCSQDCKLKEGIDNQVENVAKQDNSFQCGDCPWQENCMGQESCMKQQDCIMQRNCQKDCPKYENDGARGKAQIERNGFCDRGNYKCSGKNKNDSTNKNRGGQFGKSYK